MVALKHQLRLLLFLQLWSAILWISSCLFLFHSRPVVYLSGAFLATLMHFALLIGRLSSCNSSARDWGNLHFIEAAAAKTDAMCSLMWNTACSVSASTHTHKLMTTIIEIIDAWWPSKDTTTTTKSGRQHHFCCHQLIQEMKRAQIETIANLAATEDKQSTATTASQSHKTLFSLCILWQCIFKLLYN